MAIETGYNFWSTVMLISLRLGIRMAPKICGILLIQVLDMQGMIKPKDSERRVAI